MHERPASGFTLLEILLVVAVLALIAGIGAPLYQSSQVRNDVEVASYVIVQSLQRAQILSQAVDGDTTWGVRIESGVVTLFRGSNFASRDPDFDEVFDIAPSITPSGIEEIVFSKFSGEPQSIGTITLSTSINATKTITINEKGLATY